mgnify:CR=1 FL=1
MLQIRNWIICFLLVIGSFFQLNAQSFEIEHPAKSVFNQGIKALKQGDSLMAFKYIQSAYSFDKYNDDIYLLFYFISKFR